MRGEHAQRPSEHGVCCIDWEGGCPGVPVMLSKQEGLPGNRACHIWQAKKIPERRMSSNVKKKNTPSTCQLSRPRDTSTHLPKTSCHRHQAASARLKAASVTPLARGHLWHIPILHLPQPRRLRCIRQLVQLERACHGHAWCQPAAVADTGCSSQGHGQRAQLGGRTPLWVQLEGLRAVEHSSQGSSSCGAECKLAAPPPCTQP